MGAKSLPRSAYDNNNNNNNTTQHMHTRVGVVLMDKGAEPLQYLVPSQLYLSQKLIYIHLPNISC